jgi:DNA recombination protein RmuC
MNGIPFHTQGGISIMDWMIIGLAVSVVAIGALVWAKYNAHFNQQAKVWQIKQHTLTTQLAQLTERERLLTQAHEQAQATIQTLTTQVDELKTNLAQANTTAQLAQAETDHAKARLTETDHARQHLDTQYTQLQADHQTIITTHQVLQAECERLQAQVTELTTTQKVGWEKDFQTFLTQTLEASREKLEQRTTLLRQEGQEHFTQQIKAMVSPLETLVQEYDKKLASLDTAHAERLSALNTNVLNLSRAKDELVSVLKMNKGAGTWGEMQLLRLLEFAGLQEGKHYIYQPQENQDTGSGRAFPDVKINLTGNRSIYIDAKTLQLTQTQLRQTTDFDETAPLVIDGVVQATSPNPSTTEGDWQGKAKHLAASLLKAAKDLGGKNYPQKNNTSADFVILFVPQESMLSLAVEINPDIVEQALYHKVLLATPTTLLAMLRIVDYGWQQYNLSADLQEIRKLGTALHGQLTLFADRMTTLETTLDRAKDAFGAAMTTFEGKGGLVSRVKTLERYGCKSGKTLPKALQDLAASLPDEALLSAEQVPLLPDNLPTNDELVLAE